jgi:DHA1 family multidrug resistance protein-like MFS transporter
MPATSPDAGMDTGFVAGLRSLPREVGVLVGVAFAVAIGFTIVVPALPIFARQFGVGRTAAGAVISAFAFARLVSALLGGRLVDRLGERLVLALGIGIVAVSSALAGLSQSYEQLIVLRGLGGVGSAMFTVSALSLLLRSVEPRQRGRASGLFTGGFLIGGIAGPPLGGVIAEFSIRLPFFIYAGTLAVAGTVALTQLPREPRRSADRADTAQQRVSLRRAIKLRPYRAAMAANFADQWTVLGVRSALLSLFVVEASGLHEGRVWIGIGLAIVALVNAALLLPAGHAADTYGRKPVMLLGCLIGAGALFLLAAAETLPGYLAAMVVLGLGSGMLDVAPSAMVGDVIGAGGGTAVAGYQMAGDTGTICGPLVAGALADSAGFGAAFAATGGVFAAAAVLVALSPETLPARRVLPLAASAEGTGQVGEQVIDALDADREPNQITRHLEG